jgi:DNA modification methylase
MITYPDFLLGKLHLKEQEGIYVEREQCHPALYPFQAAVAQWALGRGRAAIFAGCGLGKTMMQVEWARHIVEATGLPVLIVAPLSVAEQTIIEAQRLNLLVTYCRSSADLQSDIVITNYEMLKEFDATLFGGIVCDESSILKGLTSKTRQLLFDEFTVIPYRLCCTATPAPNDVAELGNHAQFLGVCSREEMLAQFFVHDDEWRLKGHAQQAFYRWLATWAIAFDSPEDIGFDGSAYSLPPLNVRCVAIRSDAKPDGYLLPIAIPKGITGRSELRKATVDDRVQKAAQLAREADGQVIIWCGLDAESRAIAAMLPGDARELHGSDTIDQKRKTILGFLGGDFRILVTKGKIAGFGLNLQCANHQIFLGLSDSWELWHQTIRRSWRYGQTKPVHVSVVTSEAEVIVYENVQRKEKQSVAMIRSLVEASSMYSSIQRPVTYTVESPLVNHSHGPGWDLYHGDCVEVMAQLPERSVDLSIFSPPFIALYTYSDSVRDMGNARNEAEFFDHFRFFAASLLRITKPGRLACVHVSQVPAMLVRDGYIGMKDFRGATIRHFEEQDWIYHGEVCIDKDPQAQSIRNHVKGLSFQQLHKDSSWMRPALADYVLVFRAPGDNATPIIPDIDNNTWIEWARPIWYGIRETETLNVAEGRENDDDRHICPLQLGVIERCLRLWSNPGEVVLDPFAGIGSTAYQALRLDRRSIGIELKTSYANANLKNIQRAVSTIRQMTLLSV